MNYASLQLYNPYYAALEAIAISPTVLKKPSWLDWDVGFPIFWDGSKAFVKVDPKSFDVASADPNKVVKYVNPVSGNNSNDGDTSATAWKTITKAFQYAVDNNGIVTNYVIMLADETYNRNDGWPVSPTALSVDMNVSIIAENEAIISGEFEPLTWTLESGNIYKATRSAISTVYDSANLTSEGYWTEYEKVATVADITSEGKWAYISDVIYVWCIGGGSPAARDSVKIIADTTSATARNTQGTLYLENITFAGRRTFQYNIQAGYVGKLVANKCQFNYTILNNGLTVLGCDAAYLFSCKSIKSKRDGFNYHATGAKNTKVFEYNCFAVDSGTSGESNNNCSTQHDGGTVVRVGGEYLSSGGPVIADINSSKTWCVGSKVGISYAPDTTRRIGYCLVTDNVGSGGHAQLDYCYSEPNDRCDVQLDTSRGLQYAINNWIGADVPPNIEEI